MNYIYSNLPLITRILQVILQEMFAPSCSLQLCKKIAGMVIFYFSLTITHSSTVLHVG